MASYHGNTRSEPPKSEQIINELFLKILQIIVESRCPHAYSRKFSGEQAVISSPASSSSSSSSIRSRDKWFNLAMKNWPAVREKLDSLRQTSFDSMVIDVILVRRSSEKIIERWVVQYEGRKEDCSSSDKRCSSTSLNALYRKSMLLLRSLYSTVKLLPAYKFFHGLNSSCQVAHRVSAFVEPFTHIEESEMQHFLFIPLETIYGKLSLSVLYILSIPEANSDILSSRLPISSPQVISNYIGSPLSNPIKKFSSLVCSLSSPPPLSIAFSGFAPLSISNCSSSSASRSDRKSGLSQNSPSTDDKQQCPFGKPSSESGRNSAVKTSFSSRLSLFEDKLDDSDFCGAFAADEDLTNDPASSRRGYFDEKGGNQDVAVGALIEMLKKATPLHGAAVVVKSSNRVNPASSGECFLGKTTADALEELRSYRDVKHLVVNSSSGTGTVGATIINLG